MPFELQQEFTRSSLHIPPHIWETYNNEKRGKTIAVEIIKSRLDVVERFNRELDNNRKKNKNTKTGDE